MPDVGGVRWAGAKPVEMVPGLFRRTLAETADAQLVEIRAGAGADVALHSHPAQQITYVISGQVDLTVDGVLHSIMPGDSCAIPGRDHAGRLFLAAESGVSIVNSGPDKPPPIVITPPSWLWIVLGIVLMVIVFGSSFLRSSVRQPVWSLTDVSEAAKNGEIIAIEVSNTTDMTVTLMNGRTVYSSKDPSSSAIEQLAALGVSQDALTAIEWNGRPTSWDLVLTTCIYMLPLVFFVAAIAWLLRRVVKYQPPAQK